jgi:hypothetical protein
MSDIIEKLEVDLELLKSPSYGYRKFKWIQQQKEIIAEEQEQYTHLVKDHNLKVLDQINPKELPRG